MYNYFMLMGRTIEEPKIEEFEDGKKQITIKLEITRDFLNTEGKYDKDVLSVTCWDFIIDFIQTEIQKGMTLLIKGRIQANEQGINLIGERIMFFNKA